MTLSRVTFECFDEESDSSPPQSADYLKGVQAGIAQAELNLAAHRQRALGEISATLADMAFGYAEARAALLDEIRPVLAQISESLLPALAHEVFAEHLTECLFRSFDDTTDEAIEIAVAPDMVKDLAFEHGPFVFVADPALSPGQAILRRTETHIMIDVPALLDALQSALRGLDATQRTQLNG